MRIIGGKWKGRNLSSFSADHIRPTTDRVKESLFNIWQNEIEGARCLDLFCGTGSLGLEALSRGASLVTFVDQSKKSLEILRKNLNLLNVSDEVKVIQKEALSFLKATEVEAFDLVFIDPPFTEKMADEVMTQVSSSKIFKNSTLISIESARREKLEKQYGSLIQYNQREYGDKFLSFFKFSE